MTKKLVALFVLLVVCVCSSFGFAACSCLNISGCEGCGKNNSKIDETANDDLESFNYTKTGNSLIINNIKDKTVEKIILPEETTTIGESAFKDCTNLITIVIGDNVIDIKDDAFQNCDNLDTVYYKGTEETWNGIAVGENNEDLTSAHTYYYSEVYPENFAEDTYWHYDGDNAVIWEKNTEPPISHTHNYVNGVCSVCGAEEPTVNPPQSDVYTIDGDYIYFGTYPQSDVTVAKGGELSSYVQTKPSNGNNNGWTSYHYYISSSNTTDFMWYKDVDVDNNGTKDYRAVYFTSYRPYYTGNSTSSTYQEDNGYNTGNVYWFKYEPIKWRILSQANGKATILAELILDSQDYNYTYNSRTIDNKTVYGNNYAYSSIRAWLNDDFYNTAFNEYEKAIINTIEVDNSARSTNPDNDAMYWNYGANNYACENTYDKVWLLSEQEVTKAAYRFDENPYARGTESTRIRKTSDYAQCQGAYTHNYGGGYDGNGYWWLRSSLYYDDHYAWLVCIDGDYGYYGVDDTDGGVVPALQISLSADEIVGTYEVYSWAIGDETVYAGQEYNGETFNAEDLIFNVNKDGTCRFVHMGVLSYEGTWEKIANGEYRCIVRHVDAEDWFITDNFTLEHGKITFGEFFADYVFIKQN